MNFRLFLFIIVSFISCTSDHPKHGQIQEGFIETNGNYTWGVHRKKIIVKNLENSCKIFAITDERGKILYQQPLNKAFSDHHYWLFYADDKDNVYYYNSDYSEAGALIWNSELKIFDEKDFCSTLIHLPEQFKEELKNHETVANCISLK